MSFAEDFDIYRNNVFPGILHDLSASLGVGKEALEKLGVGYYPAKNAWVFPERDAQGEIIGLSFRSSEGKKWMAEGSKRGLYYALNTNAYTGSERYKPGRQNWVRVTSDLPCPVCGKPDWCMVSSDNPQDPSAVICPRTPEKARKYMDGSGYLHIRKANGNKEQQGVLEQSDDPVLIVEGYSDTATAIELGFVAVGKPSASGGHGLIMQLPLAGRTIWVLGENDAGAGKEGMEKTFLYISELTQNTRRALPPQGIKDLRAWVNQLKLTKAELIAYFNESGQAGGLDDVFESDAPLVIASRFLQERMTYDGVVTLRNYKGQWMEWKGSAYQTIDDAALRGQIYSYVEGKQFAQSTKDGILINPYKATRSKVSDIIDAANCRCVITKHPPVWLGEDAFDFKRALVFQNGVLDLTGIAEGKRKMLRPTPKIFSFNAIPYDYDEDARCPLFEQFLTSVFKDPNEIRLLKQWMGYLLIPEMAFEKFMMFLGPPRSGKGTIIESLTSMLGEQNCTSATLQSFAKQCGMQPFVGKLAVFMSDVKAPRLRDTPYAIERVLQITGGDSINVDRKFLTEISVHLTCRFTMALNEIPELPDYSSALQARLLSLEFKHSYAGHEDIMLKANIKQQAAKGMLINYALEGLQDLLATKRFIEPENSETVRHGFQSINNPLWTFMNECCDEEVGAYVPCRMLYDAWRGWNNQLRRDPGSFTIFARRLTSAMPNLQRSRLETSSGEGDDRGREYVYMGFRVKPWVERILGKP